jgi:hypothetical protein
MEVGLLGPIRTIPSAVIAATIAAAARVHARTDRSTLHQGPDELLFWLNGSLQGWANYFRHGLSKDAFNAVGYHAWRRIGHVDTPQTRTHLVAGSPAPVLPGQPLPPRTADQRPQHVESPVRGNSHAELGRAACGNGPRVIPAPRRRPTH